MGDSTETTNPESVDLEADYANNTLFEPSVWDLKIIFGEFIGRTSSVDWHTSITIPWAQAKLMAYYLAINVAFHELNQGFPIHVPTVMLPPETPPLTEAEKNNPTSTAMHEFAVEYRKKFLEALHKTPSV
jgi:hypothetical protein